MANHKSAIKPRISVTVPPEMIFAATALAASEYCSIGDVVRRALAEELTSRGYLGEEAA